MGEDTRDAIGHSVRGEPVVVKHRGELGAERKVLVAGSIHGDEREGHRIVRGELGHDAVRRHAAALAEISRPFRRAR